MDDRDLIRAHISGDASAFGQLVDRYIDRVFSFAQRLSGDAALAEDATQETFIKAWKGIKRFEDGRSFKAWLFAIARNATTDLLRRRKNVAFTSLDGEDESFADGIADDAPLPDIVVGRAELARAVDEVLGILGALDRSIVLLHDVEDLTFEEIASTLDRPMNTVKSRYRRAIMSLRDALHQKGGGERIF